MRETSIIPDPRMILRAERQWQLWLAGCAHLDNDPEEERYRLRRAEELKDA